MQQVFDHTLIDEAFRVVMRPIDPDPKAPMFRPREATAADVEGPSNATLFFSCGCVYQKMGGNTACGAKVCMAVPSLKAILKQYQPEKAGKAAPLNTLVAVEPGHLGLAGDILVLKQLAWQACV